MDRRTWLDEIAQSAGRDLSGFLTCNPNKIVAPIHTKATQVILITPAEVETWLTA